MECLLFRRVNPHKEKGNCLLGDGGEGRMKRTHANESTGSNLTVSTGSNLMVFTVTESSVRVE